MIYKKLTRITAILFFFVLPPVVHAQSGGLSFDLPHPKKFENHQLRSEKTGDKKFTIPRRFIQNTTSHYNFFFNANEKLKTVVARAKDAHKDDYTKLLSFYNYSFETTAQSKTDLDSVIYKATAGILLHDLRTNWVDNFFLLMGRAYYLKKDFDSAYLTFQYLNYTFSPKEKDGYDKVIGSNSNEGGTAFSISTNEKRNIAKKLLSRPPSRNESLVWLIKTYIAADALPEAAGLIQTLKYDPLFPPRLKADLDEVQAWYFYKQQAWDSSAFYLEAALGNAANKQERARWEYLIAQEYEASRKHDLAKEFYDHVRDHTIDPVMEVYAVLNSIRQGEGTDDKAIQDAVDALSKMGRKDKYVIYRDIIYYTAAQIELDRKQDSAAKKFLEKSIKYSIGNTRQKSKSFLALANIDFEERDFINAKRFYDSTEISSIAPEDLDAFKTRKNALTIIAAQQVIINRQDSLQKIAAMPEAERNAYIKKLLKQLRKQQGLKDEDVNFGNTNVGIGGNNNDAPVDLFGSSTAKTDWYFANAALRGKGFNDFKAKWGNRPNADNWQRSAAIKQQLTTKNSADKLDSTNAGLAADANKPLTIDALKGNLPLTPEKLKASNDSIMRARFAMGKALQDNLEEYADAIEVYEKLLAQFPGSPVEENTLFNLYYCYKKVGNQQKMLEVKQQMETKYGKGKFTGIINNPVPVDSGYKKAGSEAYNDVYNLFIEGKFAEALAKKRTADSIFGRYYWTPQLLYIVAVYHVHQREDSVAKAVLNNINTLYPNTPMAAKAKRMIDVLNRRKQIEDYLTKLQIERPKEDSTADPIIVSGQKPAPVIGTPMVQGKVVSQPPKRFLLTDSSQAKDSARRADSLLAAKKAGLPPSSTFVNMPDQPHYVVLVMDKVDPVYVSEAKNAFNRYNKETYYNQQIDITPLPLTDDIRFLLIGKFENAAKAIEYLSKTQKIAAAQIIPWMPAPKYSFIIITENNLDVMKNNKDVPGYKKFLIQNFKDTFK